MLPRRSESGGRKPDRQESEDGGVGTGAVDTGGLLYHPGADLEQSPTDGGELGPGEIHPARLGIAALTLMTFSNGLLESES